MMGDADSRTMTGSLASARAWDLPHELLDTADLRRRFPAFAVEEGTVALQVLADLVTERATAHPIGLFDPARPTATVQG
jgi:hypothetical protein